MLSVGDWHTLFSIPQLWHRTNQQCGWSAIQAASWLSMWAPKNFGVSFLQPVRRVRSCAKVRLSQAVCRLDSLEKRISCSSTNGRTWPFVCKPTWLHSVPSDGATRNALLGSSLKEIQDLGWGSDCCTTVLAAPRLAILRNREVKTTVEQMMDVAHRIASRNVLCVMSSWIWFQSLNQRTQRMGFGSGLLRLEPQIAARHCTILQPYCTLLHHSIFWGFWFAKSL